MTDLIYSKESYKIIGCCFEVHKNLGNGFLEAVYKESLEIEFNNQNIPFNREIGLDVYFKGIKLKKKYFADFICYNKVVVEIKAVEKFNANYISQILNYLKSSDLRLGLLINFGERSLKYKRIIF